MTKSSGVHFFRHPLAWLTAGIFAALTLPALFMKGMFFDGVMYANLSMNYAAGIGTFWEPVCTKTVYAICHEQPPLFFFLQGTFFRFLGDSFVTERIYAFVAALLNILLLLRIMRLLGLQKINWLPVLLWSVMPVTFWAFQNNVIEGTMSVFVLAALIHLLRALHLNKHAYLHLVLAGGWLVCAGITKGPQGMFLLAAPAIWWLTTRQGTWRSTAVNSLLILLIPAAATLFFWLYEPANQSFSAYLIGRFGNTFAGAHNTSSNRFFILFELLLDVLPSLAIIVILWWTGRKTTLKQTSGMSRIGLFLLVAGLSGILPLMVTLEQRGFYLVTALPLLALSFAVFIAPATLHVQEKLLTHKRRSQLIASLGMLLVTGALFATFFVFGSYKRDAEKLRDLDRIATIVPEQSCLSIAEPGNPDWALLHNAWRFHKLCFATQAMPVQDWLLLERGQSAPPDYQELNCGLEKYVLWKKIVQSQDR